MYDVRIKNERILETNRYSTSKQAFFSNRMLVLSNRMPVLSVFSIWHRSKNVLLFTYKLIAWKVLWTADHRTSLQFLVSNYIPLLPCHTRKSCLSHKGKKRQLSKVQTAQPYSLYPTRPVFHRLKRRSLAPVRVPLIFALADPQRPKNILRITLLFGRICPYLSSSSNTIIV